MLERGSRPESAYPPPSSIPAGPSSFEYSANMDGSRTVYIVVRQSGGNCDTLRATWRSRNAARLCERSECKEGAMPFHVASASRPVRKVRRCLQVNSILQEQPPRLYVSVPLDVDLATPLTGVRQWSAVCTRQNPLYYTAVQVAHLGYNIRKPSLAEGPTLIRHTATIRDQTIVGLALPACNTFQL